MNDKIKKISKKVMIGAASAMLVLSSLTTSTHALTGITSHISYKDWVLVEPDTGKVDGKEGYFMVNGEEVFCVDYFTDFHSGKTVTAGSFKDIGISEETARKLSLVAYYGSKVEGRTDRDWYAITQGLLWRIIHNRDDLKYVRTNTAYTYEEVQKCWNEILADVDRYYVAPSFSDETHSVDSDGALKLNDTKGVLSDMIVADSGGLDVSIQGNQLVVNGNSNTKDEVTITLKKYIPDSETGTSIVYTAPDCQSVANFRVDNSMEAKLKIKINRFGKLELTKFNEDKSGTVPQTVYRITGPNGFDETHTTNDAGKIILNRLPVGEYKAVEIQAGTGYLIDTTEFSFTIKADETTSIDPTNLEPKGKIELTKSIDSSQADGLTGDANLKGNVYGLYAKEDIKNKAGTKVFYEKDELISQKETDNNGQLTWDDLFLGQYYIKELKSNDSLVLNSNIIEVAIEYQGQTVSKVISQKETSNKVNMQKIRVFKSGEKDGMSGFVKGLQGAEFTFRLKSEVDHVGWDNAQTYAMITTDENGYATTGYLPYGAYLVKETKTPQEYITAPDFTISVTDDYSEYIDVEQIKTVNINNRPFTSQVKLVKKDKDTNQTVTLNSASFKIKDEDGNYVTQKVFGQKIDTFTTNSKNQVTALFGNKGEVTVPLQLDAGTYTVEEIKVPEGFLELEQPVQFTVTNQYDYDVDEDDDPILEVVVQNPQPKGKIIISKTDKNTGNALKGVEYELTAKEDIINAIDGSILYEKGQVVAKGTTDENGQIIIDDLFMGHYVLKETLTNEGYVLSQQTHDIVIEQKDTSTKLYTVEVNVTNIAPIGEIHLVKTDKDTGDLLGGVTYQLTAKEDIYSLDGRHTLIYEKGQTVSKDISEDGLYVTNELGEIHISELPLGQYELKETQALEGYARDENIYSIDLSYDGSDQTVYTHSMNVTNQKTVVEISKKDITDGNELEGAKLTLFDKDDQVIETWTSTNEPHIIKGLLVGEKYRLHEDLAPLGYVKTSDITFTVNNTTDVQKVEMIDDVIRVEISKQDIVTGKELPGAQLQIIDENSKVIHEWVTTDKPHLFEKLPAGEYTLREMTAPDGYEIAEDIAFTVEETGDIQKVVMKDKPVKKEVVKTGDHAMIMLYVCGVAIAGLGCIYFIKKKKHGKSDGR